jgi:hypothetical protein
LPGTLSEDCTLHVRDVLPVFRAEEGGDLTWRMRAVVKEPT